MGKVGGGVHKMIDAAGGGWGTMAALSGLAALTGLTVLKAVPGGGLLVDGVTGAASLAAKGAWKGTKLLGRAALGGGRALKSLAQSDAVRNGLGRGKKFLLETGRRGLERGK